MPRCRMCRRRLIPGESDPCPPCLARRNALVLQWRHLPKSVAKALWHTSGVRRLGTISDVIQIGTLGLIRAAEKYDPGRGTAFSTLAYPYVEGFIRSAAHDSAGLIRVPRMTHVRTMRGEDTKCTRAAGRVLRVRRLPPVDMVAEFATVGRRHHDLAEELAEDMLAAVESLPQRLRFVLVRRLGLDRKPPATLAAVAAKLGVSKQRVEQLQREALGVVRERLK